MTFIKPFLSIIDKGVFFRKPFGWLYILLAILSLIAPIYLIYSSVNLHIAYQNRENTRHTYEAFNLKFEGLKQNYETSFQNYNKAANDAQNAYQNYRQANQNVTYYQTYSQYYPQEYQNAREQSKQWLSNWKNLDSIRSTSQKEYEKIKPAYDKDLVEFNRLNNENQIAMGNYESKAPQGAFHLFDNNFRSVIGLALFCLLSILVGWINFMIFWNRKSTLNLIHKEDDEFTAIPVFAHFIQTIGESMGAYIGVMGFFTLLIALLCKVCFGVFGLNSLFPMSVQNLSEEFQIGIPYLLVPLIAGFLVVILSKIVAEGIKAFAIIANNTGNMLLSKSELVPSKEIEIVEENK